jgi:fructokinase
VSSFAILGEALIDLQVVTGDRSEQLGRPAARAYTAQPGGSPFNVAVGLARLGRRAEFVGRFAEDALAGILRQHARQSGVSLRHSGSSAGSTPAALFDLDEDGAARYEFHLGDARESMFSAAEAARIAAEVEAGGGSGGGVDAVHFGSLASWLPGSADAVLSCVTRLRRSGLLVSFDPNIRGMLLPDRAEAQRRVDQAAAASDLIKASAEDLAWLRPESSPELAIEQAVKQWLSRGALAVIVTKAADGADCYTAAGHFHGSSAPVVVVDTVGAGDAFTAGLLAGLAEADALTRDGLAALLARGADLTRLLNDACAHAAATCARPGADPPWGPLASTQNAARAVAIEGV